MLCIYNRHTNVVKQPSPAPPLQVPACVPSLSSPQHARGSPSSPSFCPCVPGPTLQTRTRPIKENVKRKISPSAGCRSFFCLGIQPNCLNVHSRCESGLPLAKDLVSSPWTNWRKSSYWFPFHCRDGAIRFLKPTSLTVIHGKSGNAWSYLRHVAYGFVRLSEGA